MYFKKLPKPVPVAQSTVAVCECLAKTRRVFRNGAWTTEKGCDLYTHLWTTCRIVQAFRRLWKGLPLDKLILPAALWLAAVHDIGKASPGFLSKIYRALGLPTSWGKYISELPGGHACGSEIALEELFGSGFAKLAGCHHGRRRRLGLGDSMNSEALGGEEWQALRIDIIKRLKVELALPECDFNAIPREQYDLILGATVLADWLSSGMDLPYGSPLPGEDLIDKAIRDAGFTPPKWRPGLKFEKIFEFAANPLQLACENLARPGGIYVIESGMGSGKTEAALSIAYQLLSSKRADGLYFAMPTKLTSEKIFDRLNIFLRRTLAEDTPINPLLIHGDSWLEWSLQEGEENGFETRSNGSWFQSKKRALLAAFAAGTVDQALLSVINVRHRALRAFALAGKVVVLDEVHSYDNYTGSLIVSLVRRIREWGGTVVILSATLTAAARARLLGVEADGCFASDAYPLISFAESDGSPIREIPVPTQGQATVALRHCSDDATALDDAMAHAERGEQVLWIENTVQSAQKIFRQLQISIGRDVEIGLIHSRFPSCIREENEDRWVGLWGRGGAEERRRRGRILVATQVLEQSVDVDADFLITRLAPGDMLLQRLGRLWRHPLLDAVRPVGARREALILLPDMADEPDDEKSFTIAALPYVPYWVLRTLRVWRMLEAVSLPADIRPLLERIYADEEEKGVALKLKNDMLKAREDMERRANIALGSADDPDDDDTASTRINDCPEVQLLLIKKGNCGASLSERIYPFFAEDPVVVPAPDAPAHERVAAVRKLLRCMIRIPEHHAPSYEDFATASFLGNLMWTGNEDFRPVRAAYIDDSGLLFSQAGSGLQGDFDLSYHKLLGFCAERKEYR